MARTLEEEQKRVAQKNAPRSADRGPTSEAGIRRQQTPVGQGTRAAPLHAARSDGSQVSTAVAARPGQTWASPTLEMKGTGVAKTLTPAGTEGVHARTDAGAIVSQTRTAQERQASAAAGASRADRGYEAMRRMDRDVRAERQEENAETRGWTPEEKMALARLSGNQDMRLLKSAGVRRSGGAGAATPTGEPPVNPTEASMAQDWQQVSNAIRSTSPQPTTLEEYDAQFSKAQELLGPNAAMMTNVLQREYQQNMPEPIRREYAIKQWGEQQKREAHAAAEKTLLGQLASVGISPEARAGMSDGEIQNVLLKFAEDSAAATSAGGVSGRAGALAGEAGDQITQHEAGVSRARATSEIEGRADAMSGEAGEKLRAAEVQLQKDKEDMRQELDKKYGGDEAARRLSEWEQHERTRRDIEFDYKDETAEIAGGVSKATSRGSVEGTEQGLSATEGSRTQRQGREAREQAGVQREIDAQAYPNLSRAATAARSQADALEQQIQQASNPESGVDPKTGEVRQGTIDADRIAYLRQQWNVASARAAELEQRVDKMHGMYPDLQTQETPAPAVPTTPEQKGAALRYETLWGKQASDLVGGPGVSPSEKKKFAQRMHELDKEWEASGRPLSESPHRKARGIKRGSGVPFQPPSGGMESFGTHRQGEEVDTIRSSSGPYIPKPKTREELVDLVQRGRITRETLNELLVENPDWRQSGGVRR